ncbi:MAG: hypothetical protein IKU53_03545 [Firmicutes bacterium]|nr:hypothetical protein [Bacillota bacterium]
MKNIIIIIGTILLGIVIVDNLVLGDANSLKSAAENIVQEGTTSISSSLDFSGMISGGGQ